MSNGKKTFVAVALSVTALVAGTQAGCESHAGNGALIGGAAGAGLGAIIGNNSGGRTAEGALIGGAVGALGGGLIGNEMDKKEARAEREDYRGESRRGRYRRDDEAAYVQERRYEEDEDGNRFVDDDRDAEAYEDRRADVTE